MTARGAWAMCVAVLLLGTTGKMAVFELQRILNTGLRGCTISAKPVNFGEYDTHSTRPLDGLGTISYICGPVPGKGAARNVRIEISEGSTGSFDRALANGSELLPYNLYLDASHTHVWGDGSDSTDYYFNPHPPNFKIVRVPVYARIPPLQDATTGEYADIVQVKILF